MRPHVELIQEADLCWHQAELPRGEGKVRQRNLSYDEEDGSASTRVVFESAWHRPAGYNHADVEWYVMHGNIKLGEQTLGRGSYFRAPAGLSMPAVSVEEGTDILIFRDTVIGAFPCPQRIGLTSFPAVATRHPVSPVN